MAEFPDVVYVVLGATHPHELRTHGETYRLGLEAIARIRGIENNVIFHNRFVELNELTEGIHWSGRSLHYSFTWTKPRVLRAR